MDLSNTSTDVSLVLSQKINENEEIKNKIAGHEGNYNQLLSQIQEIRDSVNPNSTQSPPKSMVDKLNKIEDQIKLSALELKVLCAKLDESTKLLKEYAIHIDNNEQYPKRENLIIKGLRNIPTHLKGYMFSSWVAELLNNLIPNLDFPVIPQYISVSHPLNKDTIIVRFAIRDVRNEIFYKKKWIVDNRVSITEHLTKRNSALLNAAKLMLGTKNAWSSQTNLFGKVGNEVVPIKSQNDLDLLEGMKTSLDSLPPDVHSEMVDAANNDNATAKHTVASSSTTYVHDTLNLLPASQNNFALLAKTWPNLSEADILDAVNNAYKPNYRNHSYNYSPHQHVNDRRRNAKNGQRGRLRYGNNR